MCFIKKNMLKIQMLHATHVMTSTGEKRSLTHETA